MPEGRDIFFGIDWGTHSSKWACFLPSRQQYIASPQIHSSDLFRNGERLVFSPTDEVRNEDLLIKSLKRILIQDPLGQPFWSSEPRKDTGTSLGEAVVFSLCCLMSDAFRSVTGRASLKFQRASVAFSFPNWLADRRAKFRAAAENFRQAAAVALGLWATLSPSDLPRPGTDFSIARWRDLVRYGREGISLSCDIALDIEGITKLSFGPDKNGTSWGFIMESGAAGLPYLRAMNIEHVPGAPGLAKLLVVDVGAGSTDVGYMLRVRHRETNEENLYYFRPASSLDVAGNYLTEEILKYYAAKGEPITEREAEARKLQTTDWHELPFVTWWRTLISKHVREYVENVPDLRWLPLPVSLNLVVTGGSGLVPGLRDSIRDAVRDAFKTRKFDVATQGRISVSTDHLPHLAFRDEAEYARRAVSLGAADHDRPGLRFMQKMDPPLKVRVELPPRWV